MLGAGTVAQARLCESILKAFLWVGWAQPELREEVGKTLDRFLADIAQMTKENASVSESLAAQHI